MSRIALYSHDTFGLGHLRRCLKLAQAIRSSVLVTEGLILTGSPWAHLFSLPPGFQLVRLPSVVKHGPTYMPRDQHCGLDSLMAARGRRIARTLDSFRPDLVVVDNVPCGLLGEVLPAMRALKSHPDIRCVLALRDVLDRPDAIHAEWTAAGAQEALATIYDEVWVFGDGEAMHEITSLPGMSAVPRVQCGRIGLDLSDAVVTTNEPSSDRRITAKSQPTILVSGGGGGDADALVRTYIDMLRSVSPLVWSRIILGPDFPAAVLDEIRLNNGFTSRIEAFIPNLPAAMKDADLVVAMAGYNTICEIEAVGSRALLVPRVWPRQEQLIRARAQCRAGRAHLLHPEDLRPENLWAAIESALAQPRPEPLEHRGAAVAAQRAAQLLNQEVSKGEERI